jgi:hypothetical protein
MEHNKNNHADGEQQLMIETKASYHDTFIGKVHVNQLLSEFNVLPC